MPNYICKFECNGQPRYLEWSTIVDAPVTFGYSLEDFKRWYRSRYKEMAESLEERLARVEAKGCSSLDETLDELIKGNRAGPNETSLTKEQIVEQYCAIMAL